MISAIYSLKRVGDKCCETWGARKEWVIFIRCQRNMMIWWLYFGGIWWLGWTSIGQIFDVETMASGCQGLDMFWPMAMSWKERISIGCQHTHVPRVPNLPTFELLQTRLKSTWFFNPVPTNLKIFNRGNICTRCGRIESWSKLWASHWNMRWHFMA